MYVRKIYRNKKNTFTREYYARAKSVKKLRVSYITFYESRSTVLNTPWVCQMSSVDCISVQYVTSEGNADIIPRCGEPTLSVRCFLSLLPYFSLSLFLPRFASARWPLFCIFCCYIVLRRYKSMFVTVIYKRRYQHDD